MLEAFFYCLLTALIKVSAGELRVIVKSGVYGFNPLGFYSPQLAANIGE
ncbi:MAG: hypothetical protein KZQ66_12635 [Candidatus Thiodiazotropha sp. (ex Lucinoma aequizonata)]|nr:hypothetical protein [Candidatus Thiodiazotropha sp. (ex Lucinoma aequizonata)]MCU7895260.1 hypothetical protein [Candidatus Thiodiazotropha sp. (ex Lucinoma aequizonata)]MCU7902728.1 hypothetical protein [Candidatus Thiodiazotropha sp. (ex Lucinoma aequizonata)]MCU7907420.1 hypothetical protein [Candidatus Thiodiazotropha sp. (ex Lucinoma aequizonata)]MCU7913177.1 hypothetical protein [Candidatus Thiodiazotropha sp. (ex Lucinoma aequizonata)]